MLRLLLLRPDFDEWAVETEETVSAGCSSLADLSDSDRSTSSGSLLVIVSVETAEALRCPSRDLRWFRLVSLASLPNPLSNSTTT